MPGAILKGGQDTTRARNSPENKCEGFLHGSLSRVGKITLLIHPDNPHLTTTTRHVMVGITRSKVIFGRPFFLVGQKTPIPPIKEIPSPQRVPGSRCRTEVGCRHGQLVGSLPRSCGGRVDRTKKNDNSGPNWKG